MVVKLRLDEKNLEALRRGLRGEFKSIRLSLAVDGTYELHLEGVGTNPLPVSGPEPLVPLAEGDDG